MTEVSKSTEFWKYSKGNKSFDTGNQPIILESPLELVVNNQHFINFICSPFAEEALALGFLWNQGWIENMDDVKQVCYKPDFRQIKVDIINEPNNPRSLIRTTTGISLLQKTSNFNIQDPFSITPDNLIDFFQMFTSQQKYYQTMGGFHSAALCDQNSIRISVEDVGRHNCLDKLSGLFLLNDKSFSPKMMLLTGRISSEMFDKAKKLQVPIIVTKTTPTHNAVIEAIKSNITIVGYLRSDSFTIFSHQERIQV